MKDSIERPESHKHEKITPEEREMILLANRGALLTEKDRELMLGKLSELKEDSEIQQDTENNRRSPAPRNLEPREHYFSDLEAIQQTDVLENHLDRYRKKILSKGDRDSAIERRASGVLQNSYPETAAEYEDLLIKHPRVRESPTFRTDDMNSRAYYKIRELIKRGTYAHLSTRAQYRAYAKMFRMKSRDRFGLVRRWFMHGGLPRNIRWLGDLEQKRLETKLGIESTKPSRMHIPTTLEEYDFLLKIHPYVMDRPNFQKRNNIAKLYFEIVGFRQSHPHLSSAEVAREISVSKYQAWSWGTRKAHPRILHELAALERHRIAAEASLPKEAHPHHLGMRTTYGIFRELRDVQYPSSNDFADAILSLVRKIGSHQAVAFTPLKPYDRHLEPRWLTRVGESLRRSLEKVEKEINRRTQNGPLEYRLGIVDRTLYIWRRKVSQFGYLDLFGGECFYFGPKDRSKIIESAKRNLNLRGNRRFSDLLKQITRINELGRESKQDFVPDLRHEKEYLYGETLRFFLDVTGMKTADIISKVKAIGQQEQVVSPIFLKDCHLLELLSRLYAITASDGHVGRKWNFLGYHEYRPKRIGIVNQIVKQLGDVRNSSFLDKGRPAGTRYPHVLGRLLMTLGIPSGDKMMQEVRLPHFILYGPVSVMTAYWEEMLPEDGCVSLNDRLQLTVTIGRSSVLFDQKKNKEYRFQQRIGPEHARLIQRKGKQMEGLIVGKIIPFGELKALARDLSVDDDVRRLADEIVRAAKANRSMLVKDEHQLASRLGFKTSKLRIESIRLHKKTGRVSAHCSFSISEKKSLAIMSLIAPPNDIFKRDKFRKWMSENEELISTTRCELVSKGFPIKEP